jgi:transcription elongation factor Elf1
MNVTQKEPPRAKGASKGRFSIFEDPKWDERLDDLIRLTQRTSLIKELTGTNIRVARLKEHVDRRLADWNIAPARPRGIGRSYESTLFLPTKYERYDGAYLLSLHFGPRGPGEFSETESSLGRALDKLMETYVRYRGDLYPGGSEPRINFETYWVLVCGIRANAIEMVTCKDCGARHPVHADHVTQPACPVCAVLDLKMKEARSTLERRVQQRRSQRLEGSRERMMA